MGKRSPVHTGMTDLLTDLQRMDEFVRRKSESLRAHLAEDSDLRGLVITDAEFDELLERPLATTPLSGSPPIAAQPISSASSWGRLLHVFDLDDWERALLLLCLLPEIDLTYERLYAFLQDDVTRKRPSVDLALNLLCSSLAERLAARAYLAPDAPLCAFRLVHLVPHQEGHDSFLSQTICINPAIVAFVLEGAPGNAMLPEHIVLERVDTPLTSIPLDQTTRACLQRLAAEPPACGLWLHYAAADAWLALESARALSRAWGTALLRIDWAGARSAGVSGTAELLELVRLARREALLRNAVLYIEGPRAPAEHGAEPAESLAPLTRLLADHPLPVIWALPADCAPALMRSQAVAWEQLTFNRPDYAQRLDLWRAALDGESVPTEVLAEVTGRYRLGGEQIQTAARLAITNHATTDSLSEPLTFWELAEAARAVSSHRLGELARQLDPRHTWDDLILPDDRITQLHELCDQYKHRHQVYDAWGFGDKLSLGRGLSVLFAGPSGTGKTMAAEVMAHELALDLFKIALSGVVSKYIGETEKNLERIFALAHDANAILLFDEADALFGKRSETKDAHDRYANIEVSYLLQKIEEYDGIVILTSNLRQNLDDAFLRRLQFTVEFPLPDEAARLRIWQRLLPAEAPLDADLDLPELALRFKLSGGSIRNVALNAAFLAARDRAPIGMHHVLWAIRREFQKLGKLIDDQQFQTARTPSLTGVASGGHV